MDKCEVSERHKRYLRREEIRQELGDKPRLSRTQRDRILLFDFVRYLIRVMESDSNQESNQSTTSNQTTESNDTNDSVANRVVEPRRSERLLAAAAIAAAQGRSTNPQGGPGTAHNNSRHQPGAARTRNGQLVRPDTPRPDNRHAELLESVRQLREQISPALRNSASWSTIRGNSRSMLTHPRRNVLTPNREPNTRRCAGDSTTVPRGRHRRGHRRGGRDRFQRSRPRVRPQQVRNVLLAHRHSNEDASQNHGNPLLISRRYANQQPDRQNRRRGRHN